MRALALLPAHLRGDAESIRRASRSRRFRSAGRRCGAPRRWPRALLAGEAYPALLYRSRALSSRLSRWAAAGDAGLDRRALVPRRAGGARRGRAASGSTSTTWTRRSGGGWGRARHRRLGAGVRALAGAARRAAGARDPPAAPRELLRLGARRARRSPRSAARRAPRRPQRRGSRPLRLPAPSRPPEEIVFFVGDLTWPPNAEGIRWFCARGLAARSGACGPRRGSRSSAGAAGASLGRRAAAGVSFLGEGDDTRPHWARAAVAVVPLLAGGGTRLKILEAAACGVPVVSTPVGAEGLDFADGSEILLAHGAGGVRRRRRRAARRPRRAALAGGRGAAARRGALRLADDRPRLRPGAVPTGVGRDERARGGARGARGPAGGLVVSGVSGPDRAPLAARRAREPKAPRRRGLSRSSSPRPTRKTSSGRA